MTRDSTDPFAALLALNSAPFLPADSFVPGWPFLDQMQFFVEPPIAEEWFEDVAAFFGIPSPGKAETILETREGQVRIGPKEDPMFERYDTLVRALRKTLGRAFFQLSRSLHQNPKRRHRMEHRFREIQKVIQELLDLLVGDTMEWDLPIARRFLAEPLEKGHGQDVAKEELDQLTRLLRGTHRKAAAIEKQYKKGPGATKNDALRTLLKGLAGVYEGFTGRPPTRARDSYYTGAPRGKFLEFVQKVYALLGPPYSAKSDDAIDKDIHRFVLNGPRRRAFLK